jgi:hypothetical protein
VARSPILERALGVEHVQLVDCTGLGTGTFKDLEAQLTLAAAAELDISPLWIHSTGNTARAFHVWATRLDAACTVSFPAAHSGKLAGCSPRARQPLVPIDLPPAEAAEHAKALAERSGARELGLPWKLEGAAALGYALAEHCPDADLIVQTIGSGFGPLGYELGLQRAAGIRVFADRPIVAHHRYALFQPADAALMVRAWKAHGTPDPRMLPADPFEPTLQSTSGPVTIDPLRRLPVHTIGAVEPSRVIELRETIDAAFVDVGLLLDFEREKSAYIAIAGLLERTWGRTTRMAVVVTGARPIG